MQQEMFRYSVNCFPGKGLPFVTLLREQGESLKHNFQYPWINPSTLCSPPHHCTSSRARFTQQVFNYLSEMSATDANPNQSSHGIFNEFAAFKFQIARLHSHCTMYSLSNGARHLVNLINEEFIVEVNVVITEGRSPLKTKKVDIVLRVAVSLHIFNIVANQLLRGEEPTMPDEQIEKSTREKAISYVSWAEPKKRSLLRLGTSTSLFCCI